MAKFELGINGTEQGAAEGREAWSGELPPTGNYDGILQVLSMDVITSAESENRGKHKMRVGVKLTKTEGGKYDGYVAWGNLNLIDSSIPFVNQFLLALTDGSDEQFDTIKKAFYEGGLRVDERKKHVTDIGKWNVNSPKGEIPIKVSISNKPFYNEKTHQTTDQVRVESYLVGAGGGAGKSSGGSSLNSETIAAEEDVVEVMADEETIAAEEDVVEVMADEDVDDSILDDEDVNA